MSLVIWSITPPPPVCIASSSGVALAPPALSSCGIPGKCAFGWRCTRGSVHEPDWYRLLPGGSSASWVYDPIQLTIFVMQSEHDNAASVRALTPRMLVGILERTIILLSHELLVHFVPPARHEYGARLMPRSLVTNGHLAALLFSDPSPPACIVTGLLQSNLCTRIMMVKKLIGFCATPVVSTKYCQLPLCNELFRNLLVGPFMFGQLSLVKRRERSPKDALCTLRASKHLIKD
ncbi:hypothetical protein BDV93DRAFT_548851 [Ceratobasidium sp. AG-I]|nr:hypothetical protein BDV93DRAFT_548851 [Ceratobasidium sp. AG-I]